MHRRGAPVRLRHAAVPPAAVRQPMPHVRVPRAAGAAGQQIPQGACVGAWPRCVCVCVCARACARARHTCCCCLLVPPSPPPPHTHTHTHARACTCTQVRHHAAEQLYLALLALEPHETGGPEGGVSGDAAEAAQELVLSTHWDGDLDVAKATRDELANHLQVGACACVCEREREGVGWGGGVVKLVGLWGQGGRSGWLAAAPLAPCCQPPRARAHTHTRRSRCLR